MTPVKFTLLAVAAFAAGCATVPLAPPTPRVGMGVLDVAATPTADLVTVVRQKPPLAADEGPAFSSESPARFTLRPGLYRVELSHDGGRYGYDLAVEVRELERQQLEVELRSSRAERVEATVFAGIGLASTGALAGICASRRNQACAGAAGAAALTGIVTWFAVNAWRHDGRILASETTSLGTVAPPPVLRAPPPAVSAPPPKPDAPKAKPPAAEKPRPKKKKKP
jgi:hypothetical protein